MNPAAGGGPDPSADPDIVLDLSRLLSRVLHPAPTGVDRVEMAYARGLIAAVPRDRLAFGALHPAGLYGRLPVADVLRFLDHTETNWARRTRPDPASLRRAAMASLALLRPRAVPRRAAGRTRVRIQASPNHLDRPDKVAAILAREDARFVVLVHDLIPIEFPEYARPGGADQHRRRVATIAAHADGIVANSAATLAAITLHLRPGTAARAALLGADDFADATDDDPVPDAIGDRPYFLCLGTIEPRKNHLLLLNLWRRFAAEGGAVPRLVLVGRRGWENEQVVDMLERCPGLRPHVLELGTVPDAQVRALIRGARALLLPSFAEGYGMPVAEALAMGTPVICSDLPALREAGGAAPDYRDPLDGPGWAAAIRDHEAGGPLAAAQRARMAGWRAPRWAAHLDTVIGLVHEVAVMAAPMGARARRMA